MNNFFRKPTEDDLKDKTSSIQEDANNMKTEKIDIFKPVHEIKDMNIYDQRWANYVMSTSMGERQEGVPSVSRVMEIEDYKNLLESGANIVRATYHGSGLVAVEYQDLTNDKKKTL